MNDAEKRELVRRALLGPKIGGYRGEEIEWRGYLWKPVDVRQDGDHVHLTLTAPEKAQYRPTTNDG